MVHTADLVGHQGPVWQVSWSHPKSGSLLASAGFDGNIIIWQNPNNDSVNWQQIYNTNGSVTSSVNSIAWAPHDTGRTMIAGACADGSIVLVEQQEQQQWVVSTIPHAHPIGAMSVSWAPVVGKLPALRLATAGCDGTCKVWMFDETSQSWVQDGQPLVGHEDWVRSVDWAPAAGLHTASTLVSAGQDGNVIVWKHQVGGSWKKTLVHSFGKPVWKARWSHNGSVIAVTDDEQQVSLWKQVDQDHWKQV